MMNMRKLLVCLLALVLACMPPAACAVDDNDAVIDGILAYLRGDADLQSWLDDVLGDGVGSGSDSLIPPLLHMKAELNYGKYIDALDAKLQSGIKSVTTRQRCGLILHALGAGDRIPEGFADETIGQMGVMSYVFGLHLLNNGFPSGKWDPEKLQEQLASMQLNDGGWAVSGSYGDPDVTAMCLQALAGVQNRNAACEKMIDRALLFLSEAQKDSGGYTSYGQEACESSAQVIITLCSLGIDPLTDARFIKNGSSALDAMLGFRLPNGSFSHLSDGKTNTMACIQALCALVALDHPGEAFFVFSGLTPDAAGFASLLPRWKLIAFALIGLVGCIGAIAVLFRKRARGKRLLGVLIVCALASAAVWSINIERPESYYQQPVSDAEPVGSVWVSIHCDAVAGRTEDGSTPADGVILPRTAIHFYEGDSAFDVLTYAARQYGIHMEHEGAGSDLCYIKGMNYLYEYDYSDLSGWIYRVNGERLGVGCAGYTVADGDEIRWDYSLRMGDDLK